MCCLYKCGFFLTREHAEQVRVNKVDSCTLWNCRQLPGQRKTHQGRCKNDCLPRDLDLWVEYPPWGVFLRDPMLSVLS